jgi:hypothetical protein
MAGRIGEGKLERRGSFPWRPARSTCFRLSQKSVKLFLANRRLVGCGRRCRPRSDDCGGRAISDRSRISSHSQEIFSSIAAAVSCNRDELFPLPLHRELGSDCDWGFEPNAGPRDGYVFESCRYAIRSSSLVVPGNLGRCPPDCSRFEVAAVHAICISASAAEFSYHRVGNGAADEKCSLRSRRELSQNGSASPARAADLGPACSKPASRRATARGTFWSGKSGQLPLAGHG